MTQIQDKVDTERETDREGGYPAVANEYPYDMCYIDQIQDKVDRHRQSEKDREGQRGTER